MGDACVNLQTSEIWRETGKEEEKAHTEEDDENKTPLVGLGKRCDSHLDDSTPHRPSAIEPSDLHLHLSSRDRRPVLGLRSPRGRVRKRTITAVLPELG